MAPRPNTRVQRTRSSPSALRSPLTRSPLGGRAPSLIVAQVVCVCLVAALMACRARQFETCTICSSTREVSAVGTRILYRSPSFSHGEHHWQSGISKSVRVSSGSVILARRQAEGSGQAIYGAFILTKQGYTPEVMSYRWYLRSDGDGHLDSGSRTGEKNDQHHVKFGPFDIPWSSAANGQGYLYYSRFAHQPATPGSTYLCVTSEENVNALDAANPKWHYQYSPAP